MSVDAGELAKPRAVALVEIIGVPRLDDNRAKQAVADLKPGARPVGVGVMGVFPVIVGGDGYQS